MPENQESSNTPRQKARRLFSDARDKARQWLGSLIEPEEEGGETKGFSRAARLFLWLCVSLCVLFLIWSAVGKLDIVSTAQGRVIPSTKVKSVQHLEGGIVSEILVKEGDRVSPGQKLVVLEETAQGSSVEELEVRINSLAAEAARLEAEAQGLDEPVFPEDLVLHHPEIVDEATELFNARRTRLENDLAVERENVIQREQDISEIKARLRNAKKSLKLVREQIKISEELLKDNLTTKYKHLSFQREESQLKGKVEQDGAALPRAESSLAESKERLKRVTHSFQEDARKDLKKVNRELEEFTQRLRKFKDTLKRTVIRSPVHGVVKTLHIVTIGGVVKPGMDIVEVVPLSDRLVVEAHLPIQDIGYVQVGQKAKVTLASQDAGRFGKLDGLVVQVSPDTFTTPDGRTFYSVRIETEEDSFVRGNFEYKLIPGMLVTAYIHTGERTVLEYFLSPFLESMDQAMQER
ncbi:MAG: HlyD family type I secretion periplasmic adaptor subunit [Thermodesulfobacteriota bacterium]|nr:HlyD family type I secretion periplasmic adaptor subunit [Thermodesulfobacteriota bacterium]